MEKKIREIAERNLEEDHLFIVDVKVKGNLGNQKILIFVDGDEGISIDECSSLSRRIGAELDEMDILTGKYTLEVSSPGLDHPLTIKRQYIKNIGRALEIVTKDGNSLEGELLMVENESIMVKIDNQDRSISFSEIDKTKVKISFK